MPTLIKLEITVEKLDNALQTFNQIKVYRSDTGIAGTYSEITVVDTRIPLIQGKTVYEYDDAFGEIESYYKTSYYHSDTQAESALSAPRLGSDPATDNIMTVSELMSIYLFGVDLTDDDGNPYPEIVYDWSIRYAIDWLQHELDVRIRPEQITERYDYYRRDYQEWVFIKLRQSPIIDDLTGVDLSTLQPDLTRVKVMWPSQTVALEFDQRWIQLRPGAGQLNIVPTAGTFSQVLLSAGGALLPMLASGRDFVPNLFEVTYTAGFAEGQVPRALRELIGKKAAFGPLNLAGDLLGGAGIASQSLGIDGLSQSFNTTSSATNAGYGARLLQYEREIKQALPTLKRFYKGVRLAAV